MLVPTLPLYVRSQGDSLALASVVLAAAAAGGLVGNLPSGALVSRVGERAGFLAGIALSAVGTGGLALSRGLWLPFAACLVAGAGQSCRLLARQAYARRVIGPGIRGRLMALYGGIGRVSLLIGPLTGGLLGGTIGIRPTFAIAAALMVVGLIQGWLAGGSEPIVTRGPTGQRGALAIYAQVARDHGRIIALAGLGQLGVSVVRFGRLIVIPLYASEVIGLSVTDIGLVVAVASGLDLLLFPLAGWIMDHLGRLYAIIPSFVLLSAGMGALSLSDSFRSLLVVSLIIGLGNGVGSGTMLTLSVDLAPEDHTAQFLSLVRLLADLGRILGPVLVGIIGEWFDLGTSALVLAGIGVTTALLFALVIGESSRYHARWEHTPGPHNP
jgi:MFS family permease